VGVVVFVSLGSFGAWLLGLFEKTTPSMNESTDLLAALLGFLILIGSLIGIFLIVRRSVRPYEQGASRKWETIRKRGKGRFIRTNLLKRTLFAVLAILWPLIAYYSKPQEFGSSFASLWIVAPLFVGYVFGCYYMAVKTWNTNERDYGAISHSRPAQGYDLQSSKSP
jgi:hypothetical protein